MRHAGPADVQLAGHPVGARAQRLVQDVEASGWPAAVPYGMLRQVRRHLADGVVDGPDRRLGRAAQADQLEAGHAGADRVRQRDRDPVAATAAPGAASRAAGPVPRPR